MASTGALLTADANFQSQGNYTILTVPSSGTFFRGSFLYANSGTANVVQVNNGSTDNSAVRVIGQAITASTDSVLGSTKVNIRTNGIFQANILSGQTLAVGAIAYLTDDNELTTTSALNPKAGIVVSIPGDGTAFVYVTLNIPA